MPLHCFWSVARASEVASLDSRYVESVAQSAERSGRDRMPNVVLVIVDSFRRDNLDIKYLPPKVLPITRMASPIRAMVQICNGREWG